MGIPCSTTGYNEEFHSITIIVLWGWTTIMSLDICQGTYLIWHIFLGMVCTIPII
jgi:hypothetical protein